MPYEIEVGGLVRPVTVTKTGDGFAVAVDGHTWHVDVTRIDAYALSLLVDSGGQVSLMKGEGGQVPHMKGEGDLSPVRVRASYEVTLAPGPATGELMVHVGSVPVPVTVDGRRRWGRKDDGAALEWGPQRVTAPMPGKVVRVLVAAGETVRARQPLIVVEAMKMENELRAAREGTIAEIHARQGMSVDAGALLIVIQ